MGRFGSEGTHLTSGGNLTPVSLLVIDEFDLPLEPLYLPRSGRGCEEEHNPGENHGWGEPRMLGEERGSKEDKMPGYECGMGAGGDVELD